MSLRLVAAVSPPLLGLLLSACYLSHGGGESGPDEGIECGPRFCEVGAEVCYRCGADWPDSFCLPLDENAPDLAWERCGADPFHMAEVRCDGPEDCPAGLGCSWFGAAVGSVHLRCTTSTNNVCHTPADCAEDLACIEDFLPYPTCAAP